ncbi:MAG: nucleotidyltransferase substrate binding protein [Cyanobacteria bacterium P01_D01_bin.36]
MSEQDIRWKQRFDSYQKALAMLSKFINKGELNELEEQGLIQAFEYTHELAWKLMRAFLKFQDPQETIYGSKDATRKAFNLALIADGDEWMDMIKDRNRTSHTYNQQVARDIGSSVRKRYFKLFVNLSEKMQSIQDEHEDT